ncbi:MAG: tetratricopeptide repeat protein [Polyangiales bacterium]
MAVDRSKVLAAAQKNLAKGQYDRAIAEYRKLVDADPNDVRTWLKIGDICTKKGDNQEATKTYHRVADHYAEQGFFLKAVAVYKQIIKLQPGRLDVSLRLAEMYENLQLVSDALGTYEQVAASYARNNEVEEMLGVLGKMAELDAENIPIRIKYAEALSKAGKTEKAASEFEAGAELLREQGRMDDFLKVAERLLYHRPADGDLARELAKLYLEREDPKRALGKLQVCFKADPKDPETLELLARAFHVLGQTPKTISVYRELARVLQEKGRVEDRARILNEILRLDPADKEARQALAAYAPPEEKKRPAPPVDDDDDDGPELEIIEADDDDIELVEDFEEFEDDMDLEIVEDDAIVVDELNDETDDLLIGAPLGSSIPPEEHTTIEAPLEPEPEPQLDPGRGSIPPEIAREAQIARLLTECEVFERYGLSDKVIRQLRQVIAIAPEHVEAREKLKDALLSSGLNSEAADELEQLAIYYANENPQVGVMYQRQARELRGLPAASEAPRYSVVPPADDEESEAVIFMDDDEDEDELGPATEPPAPSAADTSEPIEHDIVIPPMAAPIVDTAPGTPLPDAPLPSATPVHADRVPDSFDDPVLDMELPAAPGRLSAAPPVMAAADEFDDQTVIGEISIPPTPVLLDLDDGLAEPFEPTLQTALPDIEAAELTALGAPSADALAPGLPPEEVAELEAIQRNSMPAGEVEEILDEVDFYIAQGLWDAGAGTLEDALETYPGHPVLSDKMQEINENRAAQQAASAVPSAPPEDDAFALAERLAEELGGHEEEEAGADVLDVEQVFEQFKKGVSEQIGMGDSETHFDLGIAYKEMGLIDDAATEFKLAMANPQRECLCHTMIGLCRIAQGRVSEAIGHYKKGLYVGHKTEAEEIGLYYELAVAYQLLDDPQEAIYYLQKVVKRDVNFRDGQARLDALSAPAAAVPQQPALVLDEVDAAFDDLLDD